MRFVPPEWAPHKAIWTAWPSYEDLWPGILAEARCEVAGMARALAKGGQVYVLAVPGEAEQSARAALQDANITVVGAAFGDIWFRDIAPIFARDADAPIALTFRVNGWGGKYIYEHDDEVAGFVAARSGTKAVAQDLVLEGGAVEFDGRGAMLTTRSCLLNPNRNPSLSQAQIEQCLRDAFGIARIFWLDQGLMNDHTDGHIDNIARFLPSGAALCQEPSGDNDPNAGTLRAIAADLKSLGLEVVTIPSPGHITYADGEIAPASHMNYIIGNKSVVVPIYEERYSAEALARLRPLFPGREIIGLPAKHILTGGGSFHCITQQEPA